MQHNADFAQVCVRQLHTTSALGKTSVSSSPPDMSLRGMYAHGTM